jgi:hypothetical protein
MSAETDIFDSVINGILDDWYQHKDEPGYNIYTHTDRVIKACENHYKGDDQLERELQEAREKIKWIFDNCDVCIPSGPDKSCISCVEDVEVMRRSTGERRVG